MKRRRIILIVSLLFVIGYLVIPSILELLGVGFEVTAVVKFLSLLPIPILMITKVSDLPMGDWKLIRIIGIAYIVFAFVDLLFEYQVYLPSYVLGYALIVKIASNIVIFAFSFLVIKYLSISKRGGVFISITSLLLYLKYSTWFLLIFRVMDDYSSNNYTVDWQVWNWYGASIFILIILNFIFQTLALDGLIDEMGY